MQFEKYMMSFKYATAKSGLVKEILYVDHFIRTTFIISTSPPQQKRIM